MRLLLLALPVLAFLPQVIPAYGGGKKCWNKSGRCRKHCKDGEVAQEICKNHRTCCVPGNKDYEQEAFHERVTKTSSPNRFAASSDFVNFIAMDLIPTTDYLDVDNMNEEDEIQSLYQSS
ncbi:defensin beta 118 [Oryctolagus cuniculus]|uniref:defensin beta 118 n=1 Tax=Oryctolagus cuniculus TaxID=9986 RepID=UPI00048CFBE6|nr:defensin beta 118 [Oryctolagus cuniculus]